MGSIVKRKKSVCERSMSLAGNKRRRQVFSKDAYTVVYASFLRGLIKMKKVIGYSLFCIGVGMLLMWIIPSDFIGFLVICACMLLGYYLFCCGC